MKYSKFGRSALVLCLVLEFVFPASIVQAGWLNDSAKQKRMARLYRTILSQYAQDARLTLEIDPVITQFNATTSQWSNFDTTEAFLAIIAARQLQRRTPELSQQANELEAPLLEQDALKNEVGTRLSEIRMNLNSSRISSGLLLYGLFIISMAGYHDLTAKPWCEEGSTYYHSPTGNITCPISNDFCWNDSTDTCSSQLCWHGGFMASVIACEIFAFYLGGFALLKWMQSSPRFHSETLEQIKSHTGLDQASAMLEFYSLN